MFRMSKEKLPVSIAIIDDDESILDSLKMVLENEGWGTHTYISGEAFLADVDLHKPDCIILDSHFPGVSGAKVLSSLKKEDQAIPVIVLTAYPESQETHEIVSLGALEVLAKPITADVIIDHVQHNLKQHSQQYSPSA